MGGREGEHSGADFVALCSALLSQGLRAHEPRSLMPGWTWLSGFLGPCCSQKLCLIWVFGAWLPKMQLGTGVGWYAGPCLLHVRIAVSVEITRWESAFTDILCIVLKTRGSHWRDGGRISGYQNTCLSLQGEPTL